jgi:hypothetical protein
MPNWGAVDRILWMGVVSSDVVRGDLNVMPKHVGVPLNLQMNETHSTELGIRLSFGKTSEFRGGGSPPTPSVRHWLTVAQ